MQEGDIYINKVVYTTLKHQQAVLLEFGLRGYQLISVQQVHKGKVNFYDIALYFTKKTLNGSRMEIMKKQIESNKANHIGIYYEEA